MVNQRAHDKGWLQQLPSLRQRTSRDDSFRQDCVAEPHGLATDPLQNPSNKIASAMDHVSRLLDVQLAIQLGLMLPESDSILHSMSNWRVFGCRVSPTSPSKSYLDLSWGIISGFETSCDRMRLLKMRMGARSTKSKTWLFSRAGILMMPN